MHSQRTHTAEEIRRVPAQGDETWEKDKENQKSIICSWNRKIAKRLKLQRIGSRSYRSLIRKFSVTRMTGFVFSMSPNFSVTIHSLALPASSSPIKMALHRCNDMTFSNKTHRIIKCSDLPHEKKKKKKQQCKKEDLKRKSRKFLLVSNCLPCHFVSDKSESST